MLRSEAVVLNFDKTKSYSWPIATTNGSVTGFSADDFPIDASQFAPQTSSPAAPSRRREP